ncbi:MAG: STAS domain-containing protein [Proteobacteria bacterium]|nr:STAS domain-containing protein [Pseudomonadota bacterium]
MRIESRKENTSFRVRLQDRMTFSDHGQFRDLLTEITREKAQSAVFDMSELVSIDSAGLGMLMIALEESRKGGWALSLRAPQGHVRKLLELACFDKLIPILH